MVRVADQLVRRLYELGVRQCFMLPGGGAMYLNDALIQFGKIATTVLLHEQAAAVAAESYGQAAGIPALLMVTTGPGGTNALTGVAAAYLDSVPMIVVAGQVKLEDNRTSRKVRGYGFQELPLLDIVAPIVKEAIRLDDPLKTVDIANRAFTLATSGRPGPVWIEIPLDIQGSPVEESTTTDISDIALDSEAVSRDPINAVVSIAQSSHRPMLLIGNGCRKAEDQLGLVSELVSILGWPVLTTWKAADIVTDDHPLFFGRPGGTAQRYANIIQESADMVLAIGARLDLGQTGYRPDCFASKAHLVMVDIDEHEIAKMRPRLDQGIVANAAEFIPELLIAIKDRGEFEQPSNWIQECRSLRELLPHPEPRPSADPSLSKTINTETIDLYDFINALAECLPKDCIIAPGSSGACSEVTHQSLRLKKGMRMLNSQGLGSMGFGIASLFGIAAALPNRPIIGVEGDGSFAMLSEELAVIHALSLPILLFVLDNDGYASIRSTQDRVFDGRRVGTSESDGLYLPSIAALAEANKIECATIRTAEDVIAAVSSPVRPMIAIVKVAKDSTITPRVRTSIGLDGVPRTRPMSDLAPTLSETVIRGLPSIFQDTLLRQSQSD